MSGVDGSHRNDGLNMNGDDHTGGKVQYRIEDGGR